MKSQINITATFALLALIALTGCQESPADQAADRVRENSQEMADDLRDGADVAADALRDADGKTVFGSAETSTVEDTADGIEEGGEKSADVVEELGEERADAIEDDN